MTQSDPTSLIGGCWGSEIEDRVEKKANRYTYIYIYAKIIKLHGSIGCLSMEIWKRMKKKKESIKLGISQIEISNTDFIFQNTCNVLCTWRTLHSSNSSQKEEDDPNLLIRPFGGAWATAGDVAADDGWALAISTRLPSLHDLRIGYDTALLFPAPGRGQPPFFPWRAQPQFLW